VRLRVAALALMLAACEDTAYREMGAEINVLTQRSDALVAPATTRLAGFGRRAVPQIETALHTASVRGKLNLIAALARIGEPESAAILTHFGVYDPDPSVRAACEEVLQGWSDRPPLAPAARAALARIADKRARGEGPVVVGEPGVR
jgi:HEAT repeat protein